MTDSCTGFVIDGTGGAVVGSTWGGVCVQDGIVLDIERFNSCRGLGDGLGGMSAEG